MRFASFAALSILLAACGGDSPPPPPPSARPAPAAKNKGKNNKKKLPKGVKELTPREHVEDRVSCASPDAPTGPECNPEALSCAAGLYCLEVGKGHYCEPCPERDSIRHEFRDRDFVADAVRDPFRSYIVVPAGLTSSETAKVDLGTCTRPDQLVATNYSYQDLRLVGIVAQGTQRKVLMMDSGNLGHIIKRGDCVGKEKAVVKDIGTGYVTFVVNSNPNDEMPRPPEERSVQLHPNGLQITPQSQPLPPPGPSAPVVAPPAGPPATSPANP